MAELITGVQKVENGLGVPLTVATLKDWFRVSMCNLNTFSPSDQMLICAVKNPWVSFKRCYHLLRRKKSKLMRYAKFYAEQYFPSGRSIKSNIEGRLALAPKNKRIKRPNAASQDSKRFGIVPRCF
ncbi:MAG TPA: hypothetical protein VNV43_13175 [Candidatus Acidoferrales bacterium]|nr:hypothetical protein [Candidatus Acidoferrales bacterium]